MHTIYLDQNLLHYFSFGFPKSYDLRKEHSALVYVGRNPAKVRLVFSDWHLVETVSRRTWSQIQIALRVLGTMNPLWILPHNVIKQRELAAFIWADLEPLPAKQSVLVHRLEELPGGAPGFTVARFVRHLAQTPAARNRFSREAISGTLALASVQGHSQRQGKLRAMDTLINKGWLRGYLPRYTPAGVLLGEGELDRRLGNVMERWTDLLRECPALAAEHYLSEIRKDAGKRKLKSSDLLDLHHAAPAVSYCDAFVTADGFSRECAEQYVKRAAAPIHVSFSLAAAVTALGI